MTCLVFYQSSFHGPPSIVSAGAPELGGSGTLERAAVGVDSQDAPVLCDSLRCCTAVVPLKCRLPAVALVKSLDTYTTGTVGSGSIRGSAGCRDSAGMSLCSALHVPAL